VRIPKLTIPILVVIAIFGGFLLRSAFTQPSTSVVTGTVGTAAVECIVDGVKCKGTASLFTSHLGGIAGISTIETFAADHRVVMTYDPSILSPDAIRNRIDAPVVLDESTSVVLFKCQSIEATTPPASTPAAP
jgi:hypothetical protein